MAAPKLSSEDEKILARQVGSICELLDVYDSNNAHVSDRRKKNVKRLSIFKGLVNSLGQPVLKLHSMSPISGLDFKVEVTRVSINKISLVFELGDVDVENIGVLKKEVTKLLSKLEVDVPRKLAKEKLEISTKYWEGFYIYRGKIFEGSRYFDNYEEAIRQDYTSPEFIQSMKDWDLYLRDY